MPPAMYVGAASRYAVVYPERMVRFNNLDEAALAWWEAEARRREDIVQGFLWAGAFAGELGSVEIVGLPETWRIV